MTSHTLTAAQIEATFREEYGRILAALIGQLGDFPLAEDALQDALVIALERWETDGVPRNPGAWLLTVARRRAIDRLRHTAMKERNAILHEYSDDSNFGVADIYGVASDQATTQE